MSDLLTHPEGMEFYRIPVPAGLVGATVQDAVTQLKSQLDALFVGVFVGGQEAVVNPPGGRSLAATDELLLISERPPQVA